MIRAALALALVMTAAPAAAEGLILSLSSHQVVIHSNFTGTEVVLFGVIERDAETVARPGPAHIVIAVRGQRHDVQARRKQNVLGLWLNTDQRTFLEVPSYLALISNAPLEQIVDPDFAARTKLGFRLSLPEATEGPGTGVFRDALVRLQKAAGLWYEAPLGVTFLSSNSFRATIPVPANVPLGTFDVEAMLFSNGLPIARQTTTMEVVKAGFEERVVEFARERSLLYGLFSAMLAILCGWLASVAFRRE